MTKTTLSKCKKWENTVHEAREWVLQHKTEVIVGAAVVTTVIIGIIGLNNKEIIIESIRRAKSTLSLNAHKNLTAITPLPKVRIVSQTVQDAMSTPISISETTRTVCEHQRREFVRTLPDGWNASLAKVIEAAEKGIQLEKGETFVHSCIVGNTCA